MLDYTSVSDLVKLAEHSGISIGEMVLHDQARQQDLPVEKFIALMSERLQIMRQSVETGLRSEELSISSLSGTSAAKMHIASISSKTICGPILSKMLAKALAVVEVNARMGQVVAAPTAGSCGLLPAVILTLAVELQLSEKEAILGLFTASGLGLVVANCATVAGAEGGCQAVCGSAAAMAAGAAIAMMGGNPRQVANAFAIALKNSLGLICDPVGGLVEVPCIKRNAISVANAMAASDMSLAGIESAIPADEVIAAMKSIGDMMPIALKETSTGGLAMTPTGQKIAEKMVEMASKRRR